VGKLGTFTYSLTNIFAKKMKSIIHVCKGYSMLTSDIFLGRSVE